MPTVAPPSRRLSGRCLARRVENKTPSLGTSTPADMSLPRNVIVQQRDELRPQLHQALLGGIEGLAFQHRGHQANEAAVAAIHPDGIGDQIVFRLMTRSEEHTSELQSHLNLVCR